MSDKTAFTPHLLTDGLFVEAGNSPTETLNSDGTHRSHTLATARILRRSIRTEFCENVLCQCIVCASQPVQST